MNHDKNCESTFVPINDGQKAKESFKETESDGEKSCCSCFGIPFSRIKWSNVVWLSICHILGIYGYIHCIVYGVKALTVFWAVLVALGSGFGIQCGSHRLWSHRSYKARFLLRLFLMILQTISVNGSVISYARDHRLHHKYVDSEADPKNASRGALYAHIGWWLVKKNSRVLEEGKKLNFDDLYDDKLLTFQHKFYYPLVIIFWAIIPTIVPYFLWSEDIYTAILVCVFTRYAITLHHFWAVNSIGHVYGPRPYDTHTGPTDNKWIIYISMGEGYHNYHHTFPLDYAAAEKDSLYAFNPGALFIEVCALLGLAYDLKRTSKELITQRMQRTGILEGNGDNHNNNIDDHNNNDGSKCKLICLGFIDWTIGSLIAAWSLILGLILRIIYVAITSELTFESIVQS